MTSLPNLDHLTPEQLRALAAQLIQRVETLDQQVETMGKKINRDQTVIEKLTHEIAQLKRLKFAKRSEQLNPQQASLLDGLIDTDIAAIEAELQALQTAPAATEKKQKPKRTALPAEFPRTLIHHEPDNTHCPCGSSARTDLCGGRQVTAVPTATACSTGMRFLGLTSRLVSAC
ncbi:TolA-binding protein [Pseudomonas cedrina]|nr:TolA-binding protein [Pseudomonas cedrina]